MTEIQKRLRKEREKSGLSIQKLADMSGVSSRAIAYWESGDRQMSLECAEKVFGALGYCIVLESRKV